jgi:hypothetical protein
MMVEMTLYTNWRVRVRRLHGEWPENTERKFQIAGRWVNAYTVP